MITKNQMILCTGQVKEMYKWWPVNLAGFLLADLLQIYY